QQREIQKAVGRRASGAPKNFRVIYSALKDHFRIPRYTCLQKKDFEAAIAFIQTVPIKTRAEWVKHEEEEIKRIEAATYHDEPIPPKVYTVRADFMEKLLSLVYTWRYLHRANLERYVEFLRSVDSPYAASMWEAVHDFNWPNLESSLDKIGYSVKELPCYKHWLSHQAA
ncbi:ORF6C domain-containing protein, partial [Sutterella wadsworthensis]|uniref:ORF6C domain-containing protein n=1 Tax=Sutterella wadsworthensis TaxID=40545 RepID=UPI003AEF7DDA